MFLFLFGDYSRINPGVRQLAIHYLATEAAPNLLEQCAEGRIILCLTERVLTANGIQL